MGGRRKSCRGERKAGGRQSRWLLGGRLVVVMASGGGAGVRGRNDGRNGGSVGCLWRRKKEKDAEKKNMQKGEGRPRGGCAYQRWGFGFVGRLRRRLLVEEECFCGVSKGWRSSEEREREKRERWLEEKTREKLIVWLILDSMFSSLRPWNPPLFIGGGRGQFCLHWRKILALDSDGKDPNRWLKVGMVHCQIVKSAAAGCLSWPLWGGATSVYLPVTGEDQTQT